MTKIIKIIKLSRGPKASCVKRERGLKERRNDKKEVKIEERIIKQGRKRKRKGLGWPKEKKTERKKRSRKEEKKEKKEKEELKEGERHCHNWWS